MGSLAFFGLHTPLVWNEIVYLVQGLSIGMVIGPVTAALMNTLPLEQARHAATATQQPALAHAADDAFIHAMHITAVWTMLIALSGAVLLVTSLRPTRKPTAPVPEPADIPKSAARRP
ncbi:hypothetical protein ACWGCW_13040 [Streptomyces sp. NPDC054933]